MSGTTRTRLFWLDVARALMALAVCAGHLRAMLFVDYGAAQSRSPLTAIFYAATGRGHEAVMVFFVLSGFLVGGGVWQQRDAFDWRRYAVARMSRLWMVLVPALVATACMDLWLHVSAPEALAGGYRDPWGSGPRPDGTYRADALAFVGNLFFLQTILVPTYGTNGPLWSLANEFWYYLLFPLMVQGVRGAVHHDARGRVIGVVSLLASGGMLAALPHGIRMGFLVWLAGVGARLLVDRRIPHRRVWLLVSGILFLATLALAASKSAAAHLGIGTDLAVGLAAAALCACGATASAPAWRSTFAGRLVLRGADLSYTLYLFHFPLVALIGALVYRGQQLEPDARGYLVYGCWLFLLVAAAGCAWWLFERRTADFRRALAARFRVQA